jgi:hypothetical protein
VGVSETVKNLRNVAIILVIAAAVDLLPGGGRAAATFTAALWVAFGLGIALIGLRLYREHRVAIYSLGDAHRALFYGGIALGAFLWAGRVRMWQTSLGELLWWVLAGAVVYAAIEVVRRARSY